MTTPVKKIRVQVNDRNLFDLMNFKNVVCFSYAAYYEQYAEFDAFITPPDPSNPWISDSIDFWEQEKTLWAESSNEYPSDSDVSICIRNVNCKALNYLNAFGRKGMFT